MEQDQKYLLDQTAKIFDKLDVSVIKEVLYLDGWCDWEECGGLLLFEAIDGSMQYAPYGYCVMNEENSNPFDYTEVSPAEARRLVSDMDEIINHLHGNIKATN